MSTNNWKRRISSKSSDICKKCMEYRNKCVNIAIAEHKYFNAILANVDLRLRTNTFELHFVFASKEECIYVEDLSSAKEEPFLAKLALRIGCLHCQNHIAYIIFRSCVLV